MSRLRVQLAKSEIDRKVAASMDEVERTLTATLQECVQYLRTASNPIEVARTKSVIRDLKSVLGAVSGVRRISPLYNAEVPDLQSSVSTPKRSPLNSPKK